MSNELIVPHCILRIKEVEQRCGYKRAFIYRLISQGKFPRAYLIGDRAVGWDSWEVDEWVNQKLTVNSSLNLTPFGINSAI